MINKTLRFYNIYDEILIMPIKLKQKSNDHPLIKERKTFCSTTLSMFWKIIDVTSGHVVVFFLCVCKNTYMAWNVWNDGDEDRLWRVLVKLSCGDGWSSCIKLWNKNPLDWGEGYSSTSSNGVESCMGPFNFDFHHMYFSFNFHLQRLAVNIMKRREE